MKNIYEILAAFGLTVPEDKKADFDKELNANYKTAAEVERKDARITTLQEQLNTATEGLKAFEGVDVNDLKGQISKLQGDLAQKDADYQQQIADMEFDSMLSGAVSAAKGKNAKAIRALLDVETLKGSKNQAEDVKSALEALKKDNGYLFDSETPPPPYAAGPGNAPLTPSDKQFNFGFTGVRARETGK